MPKDVSVIIVNYKTSDLVVSCLDSLYLNTKGLDYEVIVVDNASMDNSVHVIRKSFPQVKLITSDRNLGFGKANNLGVEHADGKYILLLNPDTIVKNNAVKIFFDFMEKNYVMDIGALGCILCDENMKPAHSYDSFKTPYRETINRIKQVIKKILGIKKSILKSHLRRDKPFNGDSKEVDYITGAVLFMEREFFFSVGGFDERFFMYIEEVDLQRRMYSIGKRRFIIKGPEIVHLESRSFKIPNEKRIMLQVARIKYFQKHYGCIVKTLYKFFYIFTIFIETVVDFYARQYSFRENLLFIKKMLGEQYL